MKDKKLHQFIEEIMDFRPQMAGLGEAASAITGTTGSEGAAGEKLRSDALVFAAAYSQPTTTHEDVVQRARELEGSLLSVKLVSGMSDAKLDKLIASLHELVSHR